MLQIILKIISFLLALIGFIFFFKSKLLTLLSSKEAKSYKNYLRVSKIIPLTIFSEITKKKIFFSSRQNYE